MSGGVINAINDRLGRVFPERRVYVRSDSGTRYWTFSPISQTGTAVVMLALAGWLGLTSSVYIGGAMDGRTAESRLEASREAYEIKLSGLREQQRLVEEELNRSNNRGDIVTRELSEKQKLLVETTGRLRNAETELSGLRHEFEGLLAERREMRDQLNALNEDVVRVRLELAQAREDDAAIEQTLAAFSSTMSSVIVARDTASERAEVLDTEVNALQQEIAGWEGRQETLLAQLEEASRTSLSNLDDLFSGSGVNLNAILKQTKRDYTGRGGGPVPETGSNSSSANAKDDERVASLMGDVERVSLMRVAIERLPFGMPTRGARRTSSFGPRRDPYRRSTRMHNGVDFAAPIGTPIYSTGEGVVTFSGRQSGYGIVVKIRHAFGFETVYAHLNKSRVKVGQRVSRGNRIADMGSTGRSTGSHLHYEIRIDGKPINPNKFMKANRNVL
ncbi:MAG: DUF5930 domain-containing protein [Paracoccaceae bacterium]